VQNLQIMAEQQQPQTQVVKLSGSMAEKLNNGNQGGASYSTYSSNNQKQQ